MNSLLLLPSYPDARIEAYCDTCGLHAHYRETKWRRPRKGTLAAMMLLYRAWMDVAFHKRVNPGHSAKVTHSGA